MSVGEPDAGYTKTIPVLVNRNGHEKKEFLVITTSNNFSKGEQTTAKGGRYSTKPDEFVLRITDEQDAYLLYIATFNDTTFPHLASEQKIKGNLKDFPQYLINKVEKVLEDHKSDFPNKEHSIKLELRGNDAVLTFDKTDEDEYKVITILEIVLKIGMDSQIKEMLANNYKFFKNRSIELYNKLTTVESSLSGEVSKSESELRQLKERYKNQESHYNSKLKEANEKNKSEINSVISEYNKKLEDLINNHNGSRTAIEEKYQKENKQLRDLLDELNKKNNSLSTTNAKIQSDNDIYATRQKSLDKELAEIRNEVENLREENRRLSTQKYNNEKDINVTTVKIDALHQNLKDKDTQISFLNKSLEAERDKISDTKDTLNRTQMELDEQKRVTNDRERDLDKANQIIQKVIEAQKDLSKKNARRKIELAQEKSDSQKLRMEIDGLEKRLSEYRDIVNKEQEEVRQCKQSIEDRDRKLIIAHQKNTELQNAFDGIVLQNTPQFSSGILPVKKHVLGSYVGTSGQPEFMPSTKLNVNYDSLNLPVVDQTRRTTAQLSPPNIASKKFTNSISTSPSNHHATTNTTTTTTSQFNGRKVEYNVSSASTNKYNT
ncbi:spindle assembly abnormal protein 6 [Acrasis kona]|uniref:Spindle assembly abnormal protein 6 n=1 Tax=Acrasis kona TaxID=1008807 RepID=A0AAW2YKK8_9EUKA